jgi:hypothetical protein
MIEREAVTLEDGLSFATNPNNLQLALKGMSATDDFLAPEKSATAPRPLGARRPLPPGVPQRPGAGSSMLDMIE